MRRIGFPLRVAASALLAVFSSGFLAAPAAHAELIPSPDGLTVYDTTLNVTWLANANLAGTPGGQFGVPNINPSGSMTYSTATRWLGALNAHRYLDHDDWTVPSTPKEDPTCSTQGRHASRFGIGCKRSALGSLFYDTLGRRYPNTVAPTPPNAVGPFVNFQPYLYWSDTPAQTGGYNSFSFDTGFQGSNVDDHFMYVLPMFDGPPTGSNFSACSQESPCPLQLSADGTTVYDPVTNVTWLADADLAQSMLVPCGDCTINSDGSMSHTSATHFIRAMNGYNGGAGWLDVNTWQLPKIGSDDSNCSMGRHTQQPFGFNCLGNAFGELFYDQLMLTAGTPVVGASDLSVGPFQGIQPYLYWSCQRGDTSPTDCAGEPAPNFQWSFSFGNGFEGTDVDDNDLYVMVYYPGPPTTMPRVQPIPTQCRGTRTVEPVGCV